MTTKYKIIKVKPVKSSGRSFIVPKHGSVSTKGKIIKSYKFGTVKITNKK